MNQSNETEQAKINRTAPQNSEQKSASLSLVNYGTMTEHSALERISVAQNEQQQAIVSEMASRSVTDLQTEPPKPAIRRKIMAKDQAIESSTPNTKQQGEMQPRPANETRLTTISSKQPLSLPSVEDFQLAPRLTNDGHAPHNGKSDSKAGQSSHSTSSSNHCHRPYPKKVIFIVANEFCERFSYYGLRTVLVLYLKSVLGFSDSASTVSFHLFVTLCYLTPILGAILGDSIWGKYKTILVLSMVYLVGELVLVVSSVFWEINFLSGTLTFLGLLFIGIGTGGIKPCVSAFGGDQFHAHETSWRENFFALFYAAINFGSLISMFSTPMLRSNYQCVNRSDCYPLAFGVPCAIMFISIVIFVAAQARYTKTPLPERNAILAFCQCVWLALKRKYCAKGQPVDGTQPTEAMTTAGQSNGALSVSSADSTSGSSLSLGSAQDERLVILKTATTNNLNNESAAISKAPASVGDNQPGETLAPDRSHWLYLASDRFDDGSIEDFRSILGLFCLFLPTPVYWCLFDQQNSLWTLQATRMDGRVPGTNFSLEPDQMGVANPIFLLVSIALFQAVFYPCLNKFNLLTSSIKRMTAGGIIAALAFVASALIELHLQRNLPPEVPPSGFSNLLLVNGLADCAIADPTFSYVQIPAEFALVENSNSSHNITLDHQQPDQIQLDTIEPLASSQLNLLAGGSQQLPPLNNYHFKFRLTGPGASGQPISNVAGNDASVISHQQLQTSCPFDSSQQVELSLGPLPERSTKLLYIEQGNGKLNYKLFNESMALPSPGHARVRLLFESFGTSAQALTREFSLVKDGPNSQHKSVHSFTFSAREGQVLLSDYSDVAISSTQGDLFKLKLADHFGSAQSNNKSTFIQARGHQLNVLLKPGTRNLIIINQRDLKTLEFSHQLLQDNEYRVSMLLQLIPYYLISSSEVMFSITGLEFSYSMAPDSMKSLILGVWSLTTAMGNILTVAVESVHPFSNLAHDFLFYAAFLLVDMLLFAILGHYYQPHRRQSSYINSRSS